MAPRARFELATLRLTAEVVKNLSAASGVAYKKSGAILFSLVAPNPAPKVRHCGRVIGQELSAQFWVWNQFAELAGKAVVWVTADFSRNCCRLFPFASSYGPVARHKTFPERSTTKA